MFTRGSLSSFPSAKGVEIETIACGHFHNIALSTEHQVLNGLWDDLCWPRHLRKTKMAGVFQLSYSSIRIKLEVNETAMVCPKKRERIGLVGDIPTFVK